MKLGLSARELVSYGLLEYGTAKSKAEDEIPKEPFFKQFGDGKLLEHSAHVEGVLHAVAAMIEVNNNALREQLKHLGVLPNQEQF